MLHLNDKDNQKKAKGYIISVSFLAFFIFITTMYSQLNHEQGSIEQSIDIAKITQVTDTIKATGKIRSKNIVLITSQTEGVVSEVMVGEGEYIKAGDNLLRMENPDKQIELEQMKGLLSEREIELELLKAEYQYNLNEVNANIEVLERKVNKMDMLYLSKKELEKKGIISKVALIQEELLLEDEKGQLRALIASKTNNEILYKARVKAALSKIHQQEILVENAQRAVDSLLVNSPFSGTVQSLNIEIGQRVSVGNKVVTLSDLFSLEVRLSILQKHLKSLNNNNLINLAISNSYQSTKVSYIESNIENGFATIVADIDSSEGWLRPEMDVDATVILNQEREAILVSPNAIIIDGSEQYIFKVDVNTDLAKRTPVKIKEHASGQVEILEGLIENEHYILNAQQMLLAE